MRGGVVAMLVLVALAGCFGEEDPSAVSDVPEKIVPPSTPKVVNATPPPPEPYPVHLNDGLSTVSHMEVESFDGHLVPISIYKPNIASNETQFPILLHSHGFGGSRTTAENAFLHHVKNGFGVVTIDMRGHGAARDTSVIGFMQPDIEIQDVIRVIDEIATWDWVLMDRNNATDPILGATGYSYAGAMQLLTAIFDPRLDAIVPEITWFNITESLAPNGAIKSTWVDAFFLAKTADGSVSFSDEFNAGWAYVKASNELPDGSVPGTPDLVSVFNRAGVGEYPGGVKIPTLIVHGIQDTLFPLNEAADLYQYIKASGAPVALYAHLDGHALNSDDQLPDDPPVAYGIQGRSGPRSCGSMDDLEVAWMQKYLLEMDVKTGSNVCLTLESGSTVRGNDFPIPGTAMEAFDLGGPWPIVQAVGGTVVPIHVTTAGDYDLIAGIPRLTGKITAPGPDTILYFSLQIPRADGAFETIVDDQVMPLRIGGPNTAALDFEVDLGGVALRLDPGDDITPPEELFLVITSVENMYYSSSERLPSGVVLEDLVLELPKW